MDINLTRLPGHDVNGNPRYVCHYSVLLTQKEKDDPNVFQYVFKGHSRGYWIALARFRKIGGKQYRAKWYGGGIVFTGYENETRRAVNELMEQAEKEGE